MGRRRSLAPARGDGTARAGKLISREMTQPSPPKITMVLDLTFDESKLAGEGESGGMLGGLFGKGKKKKQLSLAQQQAMLHERCICLAASIIAPSALPRPACAAVVVAKSLPSISRTCPM